MGKHSTKDLIMKFLDKKEVVGYWEFERAIIVPSRIRYLFRIDAMCKCTNRDIAIVEAKKVLDHHALGQLLAYRFLLCEVEGINENRIKMYAVCYDVDEIMKQLFARYGVKVVVVDKDDDGKI